MVWVQPRTYAALELMTASIFNTHLRDQFNALSQSKALEVVIGDLNGGVINTGLKGWYKIRFKATITGWTLVGDVSGSIVIDVWKEAFASLPATVADSIAGGAKPTLSAALKAQSGALSWAVAAGDWLYFNVDSASTVKQVTLALDLELAA